MQQTNPNLEYKIQKEKFAYKTEKSLGALFITAGLYIVLTVQTAILPKEAKIEDYFGSIKDGRIMAVEIFNKEKHPQYHDFARVAGAGTQVAGAGAFGLGILTYLSGRKRKKRLQEKYNV
ncbi:MAG: hypothetical protein ABH828_01150 [archaeon]